MRKNAREVAYKMLYSQLYTDYNEELFSELSKEENLNESEIDYAKKLLQTVEHNKGELDMIIEDLAHNYRLDRVYPTDRCALYIGLTEIKYFDDDPFIVAIDEAMNLCKKFSTKESLNFVNGIFAEFVKRNKIV